MTAIYVVLGALFGFAYGMRVGHRLGLRFALRIVKDTFEHRQQQQEVEP